MRRRSSERVLPVIAAVLAIVGLLPQSGAFAASFQVIHDFCSTGGFPCTDGAGSSAGLIEDAAGNLYGTTDAGGAFNGGAVFELSPPSRGEPGWKFSLLHSFGPCPQGNSTCRDGQAPLAGLLRDARSGTLYGTTFRGGAKNYGVVFTLTPPSGTARKWRERILHNFCARGGDRCIDGGNPTGYLIADTAGNLYGTASVGGGPNFGGTVFELTPPATGGTRWRETVLYAFCAKGGTFCTDGSSPSGGLITDASGDLVGTVSQGGAGNSLGGAVFALTPPRPGKKRWHEKLLYSFCSEGGTACSDGAFSAGGASLSSHAGVTGTGSRLYGTTPYGGASGAGTLFVLTLTGESWTHTVLRSFCTEGGARCTDGSTPLAGLAADAAGRLYGTTYRGGAKNSGTIFDLGGVVYSFCARGGIDCTDGAAPIAELLIAKSGKLYGTTTQGGAHGFGTVFELIP